MLGQHRSVQRRVAQPHEDEDTIAAAIVLFVLKIGSVAAGNREPVDGLAIVGFDSRQCRFIFVDVNSHYVINRCGLLVNARGRTGWMLAPPPPVTT